MKIWSKIDQREILFKLKVLLQIKRSGPLESSDKHRIVEELDGVNIDVMEKSLLETFIKSFDCMVNSYDL